MKEEFIFKTNKQPTTKHNKKQTKPNRNQQKLPKQTKQDTDSPYASSAQDTLKC